MYVVQVKGTQLCREMVEILLTRQCHLAGIWRNTAISGSKTDSAAHPDEARTFERTGEVCRIDSQLFARQSEPIKKNG